MVSWTALSATLIAAATPWASGAPPLPPPEPVAPRQSFPATRERPPLWRSAPSRTGNRLVINGREQQAAWLWRGEGPQPEELWLPLEVLQGQLGFSSRSRPDGSLDLEWFGVRLIVPPERQRPLGDEVAVEVAGVLATHRVSLRPQETTLELRLPPSRLLQVRNSRQPGLRRVVLDLDGPALVRNEARGLELGLLSDGGHQVQLQALGLRSRSGGSNLQLTGRPPVKVFTLAEPYRIVIDLPETGESASAGGSSTSGAATIDPRLQALLGRELQWDRLVRQVGGERIRINAVRLDPRTSPLELRPLNRSDGMQGLSSLVQLARNEDALVAINGGFFNRIRRLPLGALKDNGRWLSGPILNRGVVAWDRRSLPRFGRLSLQEWLIDTQERRWPLTVLNSGYVQRGLARYTPAWGSRYTALSGSETGLLLHQGVVVERLETAKLVAGVALGPGDDLLVARGGAPMPWNPGERLRLEAVPSDPVGMAENIVGGGPLLLQNGQLVLDGRAESFGPAFLGQGAPRTVIGSDGERLWLLTLEGSGPDAPGPSLPETAQLLQQLGLRDALNLDGGSSTGLVMGGNHTVRGRGVTSAVHNGLGLVAPERAGGS
ncbi:MAG: phosphodiester glycosidase family protein [Cyanobacteriota bacterium]